jgi:hypothetical protein
MGTPKGKGEREKGERGKVTKGKREKGKVKKGKREKGEKRTPTAENWAASACLSCALGVPRGKPYA